MVESDDLLTNGLESILYGGGEYMSVGPQGELFYVAPGAVIVESIDFTVGRTYRIADPEAASDNVHAFLTFRGRVNNEKGETAVTVILDYATMLGALRALRKQVASVPIHLRKVD